MKKLIPVVTLFWENNQIDSLKLLKYRVSVREGHRKCWTVDIPFIQDKDVRQLFMRFNTSSQNIDRIAQNQYYFFLTNPQSIPYTFAELLRKIKIKIINVPSVDPPPLPQKC